MSSIKPCSGGFQHHLNPLELLPKVTAACLAEKSWGWLPTAPGFPACIPKPGKTTPTKAGILEKKLVHQPKSQHVMLMQEEIKRHWAESLWPLETLPLEMSLK